MKILIVDDERSNLEILSRILKTENCRDMGGRIASAQTGYKLCVAKSGQSALRKAKEEKPDLILLDVIMPDMSGFEVLGILKQSEDTRDIPVIFITGLDSAADEEKGFLLGAVDYIIKPFNSSIVRARVKTHLRIVEQMRTIERLGLIDSLTGIPNRRGFDNRITTEWSRAIRRGSSLSLLMVDIDHFKSFNDIYGHQQGDMALLTVANTISLGLEGREDFAARWGGEEFAVILCDTDIAGALKTAENIRAGIEAAPIPDICGGPPLNLTVSIGAASEIPDIRGMIPEFIGQADKALYMAKEAGRNRVCP